MSAPAGITQGGREWPWPGPAPEMRYHGTLQSHLTPHPRNQRSAVTKGSIDRNPEIHETLYQIADTVLAPNVRQVRSPPIPQESSRP
jgi:hypothetical protein